jgi:hypothetical protein
MTLDDLQPLDTIISYKPIPREWWPPKNAWWWPPTRILEHIADWSIIEYGISLYGEEADVEYNHVRMYIGRFYTTENGPGNHQGRYVHLELEWTSPCARIVEMKDWMIDPEYGGGQAGVYRYTGPRKREFSGMDILVEFLSRYEGKLYDFGQLIAIATGLEFFDFGKDHNTCSVGSRKMAEKMVGVNMDHTLDVERTPPCWYANVACWTHIE